MPTPQADGIERARAYLKRVGGRARKIRLLNPNVPEDLILEGRFTFQDVKVSIWASPSYSVFDIRLSTDLAFSIGEPERILAATEELSAAGSLPFKVYVRPGRDNRAVLKWLGSANNLAGLSRLELQGGEAVHIVENRVNYVFHSERQLDEALVERVVDVNRLVAQAASKAVASLDVQVLPVKFRGLVVRFRSLAESDDEQRVHVNDDLSEPERVDFVRQIAPLLPEIDAYLDTLAQPWPDAAIVLGELAQFASELAQLSGSTPKLSSRT